MNMNPDREAEDEMQDGQTNHDSTKNYIYSFSGPVKRKADICKTCLRAFASRSVQCLTLA